MAQSFGVSIADVLTAFKYIGEKITEFEKSGEFTYIFGGEEGYGYLPGTYVRDKDAIGSVALLCEMTAYYRKSGKNLYDVTQDLYKEYGIYSEHLLYITLAGVEGEEKIMTDIRQNPPTTLGRRKVMAIKDYSKQIEKYGKR